MARIINAIEVVIRAIKEPQKIVLSLVLCSTCWLVRVDVFRIKAA
jgi:hypothetical protein